MLFSWILNPSQSYLQNSLIRLKSSLLGHLFRIKLIILVLYSHHHDQLYKHIIHNHNNTMKMSNTVLRKIYLSLYLKGLCVRGSWRPNRTATYWPPHSYGHQRFFPVLQGCSTGSPGAQLSAGCWLSLPHLVSKNDWISCTLSYIIVHAHSISPHNWPSEYALPLSLEWHVWLSSSGNNCHAVHRSLSSGASICDCTMGF